ncbi:MAG: alpha/beta hydrolase [bacterium]|nr:alpha/beta hydrolase [bacterium]
MDVQEDGDAPPGAVAARAAVRQSLRTQPPLRRLLKLALRTALLTYVVACIVIYSLQARLVYFPDRDYWTTPGDAGLEYEDLTLTTEDGIAIAAWYVPQRQAKGTVLFCHGNAGNIADRIPSIQSFHDLGYCVLIFDYRGYGRSMGKPTEEGTYRDAEAAWRYLVDTRHESPERIVFFGRSLGGAVAIDLATRHSPAALVVESTFTSLVDIGKLQYPFLPVNWLCKYRYESIDKVSALKCAKLFIHGREDRLVPFDNGRRLYDASREPKTFMETPGGHNDGGFEYSPEHTRKLEAWLEQTVALRPT